MSILLRVYVYTFNTHDRHKQRCFLDYYITSKQWMDFGLEKEQQGREVETKNKTNIILHFNNAIHW